jgi:hypothetical protein
MAIVRSLGAMLPWVEASLQRATNPAPCLIARDAGASVVRMPHSRAARVANCDMSHTFGTVRNALLQSLH